MAERTSITDRVLDGLAEAGLITHEQITSVREAAAAAGTSVGAVLLERGFATGGDVATVLEHEMGIPTVDLSSYAPEPEALALMPGAVAHAKRLLPLFEIEGILTVVVGEPTDIFSLDDVAASLDIEVEPVLADPVSVAAALEQYYEADAAEPQPDVPPLAPVAEEPATSSEDFMLETAEADSALAVPVAPSIEEPPAAPVAADESIETIAEAAAAEGGGIDLDVLAVADARKIAVLVSDILEDAVARGAARIHLLPYKDDFFLVYRHKGGLEKIASAPLSMQAALVDGLKSFARLSGIPASVPALGRVRARVVDRDLVFVCSFVPTVAGQRVVLTVTPSGRTPKPLVELGMNDAEARALDAMVERGRGILLVCGPVAGGVSSTYYALLAHAASAGKTVYSVEEGVDYEIPSVAQVMVPPGGPSSAAYIAAGLRQDTDVIAVDGLRSVDDVHLAVQAAGLGKLVIATYPASDIASGVRRMLDLGVEPHGLASALTLGVAQRLVRTNCPNCSQPTGGKLAKAIPGASGDLVDTAGTGCPNCEKTGFKGRTAIFEVLPFTEQVRATVARSATAEDIRAVADSVGMRALMTAGLAKVQSGAVSAEELNRVLRFA